MSATSEERQRLVHSHQYQKAFEAYDAELRRSPKFLADVVAWRARMLLCLGRLEEALAGFIEANELEGRRWKAANQPHLRAIAAIQWMLGRETDATMTLQHATEGIANGTISYTDSSRGARDGLLLWYIGVSANDEMTRQRALSFLESLDASWLDECWPGPVALSVLGQRRFEDLPRYAAKEIEPAINQHAVSMTRRRTACHIAFYNGIQMRAEGDEAGCIRMLRQCHSIENPIDEEEWYLARREVEKIAGDSGFSSRA
jgi:tetratricopeptide (TPR) repeat protein